MLFSKLLLKTTKDTPKDAIVPSHQYMIRGGFIQQVASGIYNFSPIANKILQKIEKIIRKNLNLACAQEVRLGFVTPSSLWESSGRIGKYGKELLVFKDRKNNSFILGPTHEEMMLNFIQDNVSSYKQLPVNLYQINTKFRDEARARFGILRAREFIMKDGYSFHSNKEDMKREFLNMQKAYENIFSTLNLDFRVIEADSGAIGGSGSKEFMVLADNGEDDIVICDNCGYGANIETAICKNEQYDKEITGQLASFHTPNIKTIQELSEFFHIEQTFILKTVAKKAIFNDGEKIILFFIRGDRQLQEVKALNACKANELVDASEEELREHNMQVGFIGPIVLKDNKFANEEQIKNRNEDIAYKALEIIDFDCYFDISLENSKQTFICGANQKDYHFVNFNINELKNLNFCDLSAVQENDICLKCNNLLEIKKGIEVGHIFQLGQEYSKTMNATFLDENGKAQYFEMGSYGIGVSRLLSATIEQRHDEKGCIWPKSIAPFEIVIIISNTKNEEEVKIATSLYNDLKNDGVDVLLDDRKDRFGAKMSDFELIGIPYAIIVGKNIKDNLLQIVDRATLQKQEIEISQCYKYIKENIL